ncbi:hypothetical protein ACQWF9_28295, partial [Salmonella enterica subsp. enterica serovar Infantis]
GGAPDKTRFGAPPPPPQTRKKHPKKKGPTKKKKKKNKTTPHNHPQNKEIVKNTPHQNIKIKKAKQQ